MRVSQLGIGTTLPIPSIQDLKNAPHADASKNNKHRRNSSQMVALASDSNRINNQFNTRCDHTSTQIYNLPADMPSGLRNIYMRRKWSAPDLPLEEETKNTKLSAVDKRLDAIRRRATHDSPAHKQRVSSQRRLLKRRSSIALDLDSFVVDDVLTWSNPEGWGRWSDAPLYHPDVMPKRCGNVSKLTVQKAKVDAHVLKMRLTSVIDNIHMRKITDRIKINHDDKNVLLLSSSSPKFNLVGRLDFKLHTIDHEICELSAYERQQSGLARKRPKSAPRRRRKKKLGKLNKKKMLTINTSKKLSTQQKRKKKFQAKHKKDVIRRRKDLQGYRTLTITSTDLSKSIKMRLLFLELVRSCVKADRAAFWVYNSEKNELWTDNQSKMDNSIKRISIQANSGVAGKCFSNGEALLIHDCYKYPLFNAKVDKETGYKTKTMLCIPIHGNNEGTSNLGVLQVVNKRDRTGKFNVRDASLLQLSVSILRAFITTMSPDKSPDYTFTHDELLEEALPQLSSTLNSMITSVQSLDGDSLRERFAGIRQEFESHFDKKMVTDSLRKKKKKNLKIISKNGRHSLRWKTTNNITRTSTWNLLQNKNKNKSTGWDNLILKKNESDDGLDVSDPDEFYIDLEDGYKSMNAHQKNKMLSSNDETYVTGARNSFEENRPKNNGFAGFSLSTSPLEEDEERERPFSIQEDTSSFLSNRNDDC